MGANWWKEDKSLVGESVTSYLDQLEGKQQYRSDLNERHLRLYGNDLYANSYYNNETQYHFVQNVQYNVVRACVDTMVSSIAYSVTPTPYLMLRGGDFSTRRKAEKGSRFIKGQFEKIGFYQKERCAFKDASIFGTGFAYFYIKKNKKTGKKSIECERVWPGEIVVDEMECVDAPPKQIHRVKPVNREVLKYNFPKFEEEIMRAPKWDDPTIETLYPDQDIVRVSCSTHLPSELGAGDGREVLAIKGATLRDDDYTDDFFHYAVMRWSDESRGFFGRGIPQIITGIQVNLNILLLSKFEMLRYTVPKIIVQKKSGINHKKITNRIGGAYQSNIPNPIDLVKLGTVPAEITAEERNLYNKAFELVGVSQLTALSKLPSRLDSSLAINEALDVQSQRFSAQFKGLSEFVKDSTKIILSFADKIVEETDSYKMATKWKGKMSEIDYKDIRLKNDDYSIEMRMIREVPDTPWGRTEILQQMLQGGAITKSQFIEYNFQGKDIESLIDELNADENNIDWTLEEIIEKGEMHPPESYQNLDLGIRKFKQAYLDLRTRGLPDDKLEMIREWIDLAIAMQKKMAEGELASQAPQGGPLPGEELPPASPAAPPVSNLLPFNQPVQ